MYTRKKAALVGLFCNVQSGVKTSVHMFESPIMADNKLYKKSSKSLLYCQENLKAAYFVTLIIFRKKNFFFNHL